MCNCRRIKNYLKWIVFSMILLLVVPPSQLGALQTSSNEKTEYQNEFDYALDNYLSREYEGSIKILERLIEPENPLRMMDSQKTHMLINKLYMLLGAGYERTGQVDVAREYYSKADKEILRQEPLLIQLFSIDLKVFSEYFNLPGGTKMFVHREFSRADQEFSNGNYESSKNILERLVSLFKPSNKKDLDFKSKQYGEVCLLLGACFEKLNNKIEAEKNYKISSNLLEKNNEILKKLKNSGLPNFEEAFKGNVISKVGNKRKKPKILLLVLGVLLVGLIGYLLTKKKSGSDNSSSADQCTVTIESTPSGAQIYVNGSNTGRSTPATLSNIQPGDNTIWLVKSGCGEATKTRYFTAGTQTTIKVELAGYTYQYSNSFGGFGGGRGQLLRPSGAAIDQNNFIYVCDTQNNRIQKFGPSGEQVFEMWGSKGTTDGTFDSPKGICCNSDNYVFVADSQNDRIQKFTDLGVHKKTWGPSGHWSGKLDYPVGIASYKTSFLYVADQDKHRIIKMGQDGSFKREWGGLGTANGKFNYPYGVAVGSAGNVYVSDSKNHRIQKFDGDGVHVWTVGQIGTGNIQFNEPCGVALDSNGCLFVVDSNNHRIQKFYNGGEFLTKWGQQGGATGQFQSPQGIVVDSNDCVYVVDTGNHRVQKFTITSQTEGNGTWQISQLSTKTSSSRRLNSRFNYRPRENNKASKNRID